MRRTWSIRFLLTEAARKVVIALVAVPCGLIAVAVAFCVWLLWLVGCGLQVMALSWRMRGSASHRPGKPAVVLRQPMPRRTLQLPPRRKIAVPPVPRSERGWFVGHSIEEVQLALAGMTRHAWPKSDVIAALEALGARRAWSEPLAPKADDWVVQRHPRLAAARELIHLRYRKHDGLLGQCFMPPASISVYFDDAGRLVYANATSPRIRL